MYTTEQLKDFLNGGIFEPERIDPINPIIMLITINS